jgi:hypothetical protein
MQDQSTIPFDPMYIDRVVPWQTKVFILYLLVACGIWLVRSVQLFWRLRIFPASLGKFQPNSPNAQDQANSLARSALAKKLPEFINASNSSLIRLSDSSFSFMWDECWIKVSSMNRLARTTFVSSLLVFTWLAATVFSEISYSKVTGWGAVSGGLSELLLQLTLGMGVCLVLYITTDFLEKELQKRKALWNYFCSKLEIQNETGV